MIFILETSACSNASFLVTILFIKKLIKIISIIVPALLILLLSIDIGKAVIAGSDDDIKRAQKIALKRIIASIIVFFVPVVVNSAFYLLGDDGTSWISCYNEATDSKVEELVKAQNEQDAQKEKERKDKTTQAKENKNKKRENQSQQRESTKNKLQKEKASTKSNDTSSEENIKNTGKKYKGKAKLNKPYKNIKILDTLKKNDFEILSTVQSAKNIKIAQSFAVVDNYYVVVNVNTLHTKSYVAVYDKYTTKKVNNFKTSLGHANGATYNNQNNNMYVTHGDLSNKKVHKFSASNIASKKSISVTDTNMPLGVSGVAYDDATGKMYYASGNGIFEYSDGRMIQRVYKKSYIFGRSQDFCVHNGIVYDIRVNGGNTIDIYQVSGAYLGSYRVKIKNHEIESIDYYGEGNKMAVLFNHYGSKNNYVYVIDSIIPN